MTDEMGRREFLKRGTVAGVLATTGLPLAHARDGIAWTSATPHMAPELAARHFDSKEFCLSEYDAITPALSFSATDEASARRWQLQARRKLIERLGGFPAMRSPLTPRWSRAGISGRTRGRRSSSIRGRISPRSDISCCRRVERDHCPPWSASPVTAVASPTYSA